MGKFINFYLPYQTPQGHSVPNKIQATQILDKARQLISQGVKGVAITYSANFGQTEKIRATYASGGWDTHTSGANQADVMRNMESLMGNQYSDLQRVMEIAPITTMTYTDYGGKTHLEVVQNDLEHIKNLILKGWYVLGWMNQNSKPHYAVGGGVAHLTPRINVLIQSTLSKYAAEYGTVLSSPNTYSLSTPQPQTVTINNQSYNLVAFYYPGYNEPWDNVYQAPFLGNFYDCQFSVTINSITATFHNAEAAFQCTKWWNDANARTQFENAKTGAEAFHIKKQLSNPDYSYAGLGREGAMMTVLQQKFNLPAFKTGLLATGNAYLLEHNAKAGRDRHWSDNNDGTGLNMLGITLMEIRAALGGANAPQGNYTVADFTQRVLSTAPAT